MRMGMLNLKGKLTDFLKQMVKQTDLYLRMGMLNLKGKLIRMVILRLMEIQILMG